MIIHKCDRKGCTKQVDGQRGQAEKLPEDWYLLTHGKFSSIAIYHICPDCQKVLGLIRPIVDQTVGKKLVEIIEELVTNAVEPAVEAAMENQRQS